jgi:predicted RND superfamily exporter protein
LDILVPVSAAIRYVTWIRRHASVVLAGAAVVTLVSVYLTAFHLPLRADFSHLLPQNAQSVRDLHALEQRVDSQDVLLVIVESDDAKARAEVAAELSAAARALPPTLVQRVEDDDAETRAFFRSHRLLYASLDDLTAARDALQKRIDQAKLAMNPGYVDLDSDETEAEGEAAKKKLDELRGRRAEAEEKLDKSSYISADGRYQLIVVRTAFVKTDVGMGRKLVAALAGARAKVLAEPGHVGVQVGLTAGVASTVAEHDGLVRGMVLSSIVTGLLVALVLGLYFRNLRLLFMLTAALVVGTAMAFGTAALTVGHLNAATAFLGAIIAGNGVNYGILLLARYLEERAELGPEEAMAEAIHGTLRPTLVASLGASIAYASLAVTSFRGFADFAVIGGVGMILCWIATYTLLPAMVLRWSRNPRVGTSAPFLGSWIARILGFRRPGVVLAVTGVLAIGAGAVAYQFIAGDPYEYDMTQLRSEGPDAVEARQWLATSDRVFGRGIAGQAFVAAKDLDQVGEIVTALHEIDDGVPEARQTIGPIHSIKEAIPEQQKEKLAVLGDIQKLLDPEAMDALSDEERKEVEELLPPPGLKEIQPTDLPEELKAKLREKNGDIGLLIGIRPAASLDEWNGKDLLRFAHTVRKVKLADGTVVHAAGAQLIYADILSSIENDGPLVVAVAAALLVLMVVIVVGRNIRALAVLAATALGSLFLVAICGLFDVRVTFLDFVALPITLGIGVDYAINVAHRHHHGEELDPVETLRYSGAAVFTCSLTTIIGYGSLLVSENLAIRGFGMASLIGEVCTLLTALVVVPAIVSLRHPSRSIPTAVALGDEPTVAR